MYSVGGRGVISVVSNPAPALTGALYRDYRAGRLDAAASGQIALRSLIESLFCEANPQPVKMAMHLLGMMSAAVRPPLVIATEDARRRLKDDLARLDLL